MVFVCDCVPHGSSADPVAPLESPCASLDAPRSWHRHSAPQSGRQARRLAVCPLRCTLRKASDEHVGAQVAVVTPPGPVGGCSGTGGVPSVAGQKAPPAMAYRQRAPPGSVLLLGVGPQGRAAVAPKGSPPIFVGRRELVAAPSWPQVSTPDHGGDVRLPRRRPRARPRRRERPPATVLRPRPSDRAMCGPPSPWDPLAELSAAHDDRAGVGTFASAMLPPPSKRIWPSELGPLGERRGVEC